jgi:hypothetical protein
MWARSDITKICFGWIARDELIVVDLSTVRPVVVLHYGLSSLQAAEGRRTRSTTLLIIAQMSS